MYTKDTAIKLAIQFIESINAGGIRVKEAFLFGSYSRGTPSWESDIDVAVASPDFSGFRFDDLGKIAKFKLKANPDIEVHPFAESEFNSDNPFVREIMKNGLKLA